MDNKLYVKIRHGKIIIIEFYVDDIILGSDDDNLSQGFTWDM